MNSIIAVHLLRRPAQGRVQGRIHDELVVPPLEARGLLPISPTFLIHLCSFTLLGKRDTQGDSGLRPDSLAAPHGLAPTPGSLITPVSTPHQDPWLPQISPPGTFFHHNTPFSIHLPTLPLGPQAPLAPPYLPALPSARPTWPPRKTPPPPPGRPRPLPPPHRPAARAKPGSRSHTPAPVPAPQSSGQEVAPLRGVGNTARPSPRPGFGPESRRGGWGERAPLPSPPAPARSAPPISAHARRGPTHPLAASGSPSPHPARHLSGARRRRRRRRQRETRPRSGGGGGAPPPPPPRRAHQTPPPPARGPAGTASTFALSPRALPGDPRGRG